MEKRLSEVQGYLRKVVITGAESTGKTTLAGQLADWLGVLWVPEFAREYVASLPRPYVREDLERIARKQIADAVSYASSGKTYLFFDTHLVITAVWFEEKYGSCPLWLVNELRRMDIDLFLLCDTDIPWEPDPLRENPGKRREYLSVRYQTMIRSLGYPLRIVRGRGIKRLRRALEGINAHFNDDLPLPHE